MTTTVLKCTCQHAYQEATYSKAHGPGARVHNVACMSTTQPTRTLVIQVSTSKANVLGGGVCTGLRVKKFRA